MDVMAGTTYELYLELTREVTPATGVTLDQTELTLTAGKTADGPERRATWERPGAAHNV